MSDSDDTPPQLPGEPVGAEGEPAPSSGLSDEHVRQLLRGALTRDIQADVSVLRGVQRKIRQRSRGKFYADGWSTAAHPPVYTYLVTSALMLVVLFVIYAVLVPTAGEPVPVDNEPAPVQIIAPRR
jgi:hypothetical protein